MLGSAFMRSMNLTLPPVRKQWMWLFWKVSTFFKYLVLNQHDLDYETMRLPEAHKSLVDHCISSTMSRAACTMNWFMWDASSRKRATPSPPGLKVPKSCSKSGLSRVPMMVK